MPPASRSHVHAGHPSCRPSSSGYTMATRAAVLVAAVAWLGLIFQAQRMSAMGGTMGLGLAAFCSGW